LSEGDRFSMIFTYAPDWITNEFATPLSPDIPLSDQEFRGEKVMSFFENLLQLYIIEKSFVFYYFISKVQLFLTYNPIIIYNLCQY